MGTRRKFSFKACEMMTSATIGSYQVGRVLGEGPSSKVLGATNMTTGQEYAIKVVDMSKLDDYEQELLWKEVAISKQLNSPFLLKTHEVMKSDQRLYQVMDLADGGDLLGKIQEQATMHGGAGALSENQARQHFCELMTALYHCHRSGVAHRDVKPDNILISRSGQGKLADFGLGDFQLETDPNPLVEVVGTPSYMAPEVLCGTPYCGHKADVWSAGVTLFVMLTGWEPFCWDNPPRPELCRRVTKAEYSWDSCMPMATRELIEWMLQVDPANRPDTLAVLQHPWVAAGLTPAMLADIRLELKPIEPVQSAPVSSGVQPAPAVPATFPVTTPAFAVPATAPASAVPALAPALAVPAAASFPLVAPSIAPLPALQSYQSLSTTSSLLPAPHVALAPRFDSSMWASLGM
eukprot:NODE_456_length_1464_cov_187.759717_g339_i0.p1 GENE.NODE_456_length_1464_cov_187.759717_g339_i0~~NODE_456_length_1464_cov_187.759717_g339_i0.p1  ORF type:complete len:407 (+),score=67.55 NODE_456_length_1464_cov_187.759717_g339_i0:31-1251(+)